MLSARQISEAVANGKNSATEVVAESLRAIRHLNPALNAFVHVDESSVLKTAERIDKKRDRGDRLGVLAGVPVAVKANIAVKGCPLSCCSKSLEGFIAPYNATVIERIIAEDGLIIGLCNMDEFAMGSSTEFSCFGPTHNPCALDRTAGGSSGGCAAAVAAGIVPVAIGSDTGGSVRQPAAFCGIVGMKPTYGRISRYGLVAFASSLDTIGVISSSIDDAELLYGVICGHDPKDSSSIEIDDECHTEIETLKGLRIGIIKQEIENENLCEGIRENILSISQILSDNGAQIIQLSLPILSNALSVYTLIAHSEASTNLARYGCGHFGFAENECKTAQELQFASRSASLGDEVKRRILLGAYALSEGSRERFYNQALLARKVFIEQYRRVFEGVDILIGPTTTTTAFLFGERVEKPLLMYKSDLFTTAASLAGLCAISIPCGTLDGLPVGLQITAKEKAEVKMISSARLIDCKLGFGIRPDVFVDGGLRP